MIGQMNVHFRALKYIVIFAAAVLGLSYISTAIVESGYAVEAFKAATFLVMGIAVYFLTYIIAEMNIRHEKEDRELAELFNKDEK